MAATDKAAAATVYFALPCSTVWSLHSFWDAAEYAYGAVDPVSGDSFFLILPNCNTDCMNIFLRELSAEYPKDYILFAVDNAVWHKNKALVIPDNIRLFICLPAHQN